MRETALCSLDVIKGAQNRAGMKEWLEVPHDREALLRQFCWLWTGEWLYKAKSDSGRVQDQMALGSLLIRT
jgi:hypothetical protein